MNHVLFVTAAYAVSALGLGGIGLWTILDQRQRRREIAELEKSGVTRRSAKPEAAG